MCMRTKVLNVGEKIFNVLVVLGFIAGAVSAVMSGMGVASTSGHMGEGWLAGASQLLLSWSGTLIIALVVYSLLDIRHSACKSAQHCHTEECKPGCTK